MEKRTIEDLNELRKIDEAEDQLYTRKKSIKEKCPCLDYVPTIIETLAFEVSPKAVCPVCKKVLDKDLSLNEKIECLKKYFDYGEDIDEPHYSEETIKEIAIKGGYNYPRFFDKE